MRPKPTCLRPLSLIFYICLCLAPPLGAAPARKGLLNLRQPDGKLVQAYLSGDEFGHLMVTNDGCALVQDAEGWWCYARYDYYGRRLNTGVHAGDPDTPGEIFAASSNIPYDLIQARRSARARRTFPLRQRELVRTRSGESGGLHRTLIILAQFQDLQFTYTREDFERLINGPGQTSALAYFNLQWKGHTSFQFDISEIVTLPKDYAYYGVNNDDDEEEHAPEMIRDACAAVGPDIDFSVYDNDGDGVMDDVFVFYAGPNESEGASENYVWPHQWYLQSGARISYQRDGVTVDNYACTSELRMDTNHTTFTSLAYIGTFCHEYTHTFGIRDLYDEDDNDGGYAEGLWRSIDLMDAGNYNDDGRTPPNYSAVERWFFGISEGIPLSEGSNTLLPVQENGDYYYLETDDEKEIYLIECRQAQGWDSFIGGSGLLIYHIDWSTRMAGYADDMGREISAARRWELNLVNACPEHQCVDLIEPDPHARENYQEAYRNRNWNAIKLLATHAFWPYESYSLYTCDTNPAFVFWSGTPSALGLTEIRRKDDGSVSFIAFNDLDDDKRAPAVDLDKMEIFQDACILQWSSQDPTFTGNSVIRYGLADATRLEEVEVQPYATGKYAFVIDGLTPTNAYMVQLLCLKNGIPGPVNGTASFTTHSDKKAGSYPYIYLKNIERGSGGSFAPDTPIPLRVYNTPDADGVTWYFDGRIIGPGADGYYHLTRSGELKAVVSYPSGSTDILTKNIVVK